MRNFRDGEGRKWDVTVGRESWGGLVLLFSQRDAPGVRTSALVAETVRDAERTLTELTDDELQEQLAASRPWG